MSSAFHNNARSGPRAPSTPSPVAPRALRNDVGEGWGGGDSRGLTIEFSAQREKAAVFRQIISRRSTLGTILSLTLATLLPTSANAQSATHRALADRLFDLYASQSVRLSIAQALRQRPPGTEQVLSAQLPIMVRSLARHRDAFNTAMERALRAHVTDAEVAPLLTQLSASPQNLDDRARAKLFEVDAEFRREAQAVIGAMTTDIGLMISATLSEKEGKRD